MIRDKREIKIDAPPEAVFDLIETMPNKFPVYSILETKPFFFLRERIYWSLIKPMHLILARKVLRVIKEKAEDR